MHERQHNKLKLKLTWPTPLPAQLHGKTGYCLSSEAWPGAQSE